MTIFKNKDDLFKKISFLKGVGPKLTKYLKNKRIEKINDLLWHFPYSSTDRSNMTTLDKLEVGKIQTIKVKVSKYNFPRIRNLPNKVMCEDEFGKIDIIFFNSREGYIRAILPINKWVLISGKINFYKTKYQITNPSYITSIENIANRLIPFNSLVLFGASSIFGVIIGRNFLFTLFPEKLSIILFISIMFLSAFLILKKNSKLSFSLSRQSVIFQGLIVGLLTSLLGIGGGFIIVPTLIIFQGMNIKQAVRCALFLMLLNSSFAIIIDFYNNYFYIRIDLLIPMILFSIFGMLFGEWIMNKIKIKLLTKTFSLLLIIMGIFLLFSLF